MTAKNRMLINLAISMLVIILMAPNVGASVRIVSSISSQRYAKLEEQVRQYAVILEDCFNTITKAANSYTEKNVVVKPSFKVKKYKEYTKALDKAVTKLKNLDQSIRKFERKGITKAVSKATKKMKALIQTDVQRLKKMKSGTIKSFISILEKWEQTAEKDYGALDKLVENALKPVRTS